ncbi:glycosyltransferase family 9 protein [Adhaeribacter sp. BT258]|uniref:Glycosyltransferase family 9 protein n=1 Tax=Adhaeribacter terrigena TaxID=2793070 RepID=A0ABS1C0Q0_9BACT|nr:glycosyltransferase family 9 protein [Adhaeribacter terrigena]MBK0402908.1 glycosyltransferase family 9 protein [Adhaeribacter terrigena]
MVIKILGLGSVILASDSLLAIRKKYPQARMVLLASKGVKAGIEPLGLFDEIWSTNDKNFFTLAKSGIGILFRTWKLKNLWVIDLEVYSRLTTIFSLWTLAPNRFGFLLSRVHFRNHLNTHNVYFNQFSSVEENYFSIARTLGITEKETFYFPGFDPAGRKNEASKPYLAINNTCSDLSLERKLPWDTLAAVCRWILENTNYRIALTGGPEDAQANDLFVRQYLADKQSGIENIAGKKSFRDYYQFLYQDCAVMLSIDSAPNHIARKLGLPTLSLWGPTRPEHLVSAEELKSGRHLVEYLAVACSPCIHHTEVLPCGGDNHCMKNILPANICLSLQTLLTNIKHAEYAPVA